MSWLFRGRMRRRDELQNASPGGALRSTDLSEQQRKSKIISMVYVITTLDVTCMFLQFSITPYLAKKLGFDTLWLGYLQTTVGVMQLIGGPIFGRFADLCGARMALTLATASTIVFFLLLGVAANPYMLFIHKFPTIFMHVMPTCQMVLAHLTEPSQRADKLAKMGLCFGIGMIGGSTLGGHIIAHYGERTACYFGAAGSAINLLLVLLFIPKTTRAQDSQSPAEPTMQKQSVFSLGEITRLMRFPGVTPTFLVKITAGLPAGIFQVMFSIIATEFFLLKPEENGYLMAYFGIIQMIVQGGVIGRLTARYSESSLLLCSIAISAFVGLGQAYMTTVFHFCLTVIPMMFSLSMFNIITESMLTKSVPSTDTGTMVGLCASIQSLLRTIGPTVGGYLYENHGVSSLGFFQFTVNTAVFIYLLQRRLKKKVE
ncbi:solute carrier family 22 member 18 isoform X1 [Synchiropus splendidus]|uniref:solute carrier family 22 member 18 isoform X1 n=3 Tax=Synchiropus splendidus TaxID=270530 RepID=UPI00237EAF8A|nr:solute carrier family 22 member 18 isoform X1 [Synchiropus splendidus]